MDLSLFKQKKGSAVGKEKKGKEGDKKKKGLTLGLDSGNSSYALIFLAVVLIIGSIWFYGGISDKAEELDSAISELEADRVSLQEYMKEETINEITNSFPLYNNVSQDVIEKKEVETATQIRDLAREHNASISGYETELSDVTVEFTGNNTGSASDNIVVKKREASFVIGGGYENCLAFLKDVESLDRLIEYTDIIFAGSRLLGNSSEVVAPEDFFVKYGKLNSMRVEIAYYYLESSIKSDKS